ncbi:hypothetical protein ACFE04_023820 [Oxalis oulophora]
MMSLATQPGTPSPILNLGRRPYPDDKRVSHHRSNSIHNVFGFGFDFTSFNILRSDLLPKPCRLSNRHHHVVTPSKSTTPVPTSSIPRHQSRVTTTSISTSLHRHHVVCQNIEPGPRCPIAQLCWDLWGPHSKAKRSKEEREREYT